MKTTIRSSTRMTILVKSRPSRIPIYHHYTHMEMLIPVRSRAG